MKRSSVRLLTSLATAAALLWGGAAAVHADPADFYEIPGTLPGSNGDLIRSEPSVFYVDPLKTIRAEADVQKIMYRSLDSKDRPIAVTGTVLVPTPAWTGTGARPLVSYAAGTQGQGDQCAPSRALAVGEEYEGAFIAGLLSRGYAVVVTDYEGLGTAPVHTYMARASQAHAVLDAVRAAQRLGNPQIVAGGPVAIAGYSQGGGASAAAAELAPQYAPELNLKGAYAGAVPADLAVVAKNLDGGLYTGFLIYALSGLTASNDMDINAYLSPAGRARVARTQTECTITSLASNAFLNTATLTLSGAKAGAMVDLPEIKPLVAEQKIGNGRAPQVPVLLSHSLLDDAIPYGQGRDLAKRWCDAGTSVYFDTTLGATHAGGYVAAVPAAFLFLERRFEGQTPITNCWTL
ncbi:lipase family protein [Pseudarthrobacter sp. N5]|uniref:lipase family protein n=1 Tax=Pseudarthrobacter sp. N5 TaxID=3418416 RepID=UPI003CFAE4A7